MKKKILINILFIFSLIFIFRLTMLPNASLGIGMNKGELNFIPLINLGNPLSPDFIVNVGGNIVLFIPFGLFLPLKFPKLRRTLTVTLMGLSLSILIECIQLSMPNRCTDINDVILNTSGAYIGYRIFRKFLAAYNVLSL
ncbi:VanZ family protein [Neobacillus cucumis]|uniref:VanZ family protein n=1 Tax=Neobacillus cucumis TaxID=1740721 RepID=UPI0019646948|nr:VanZ family protein [Neobacillus cucumis]MBM7652507.1 glycopeptide antibiotics resistance protein [Neobacillus cucumis]